jgi:hypothetical protein
MHLDFMQPFKGMTTLFLLAARPRDHRTGVATIPSTSSDVAAYITWSRHKVEPGALQVFCACGVALADAGRLSCGGAVSKLDHSCAQQTGGDRCR